MEDCDRYIIHNCVTYSLEDLQLIGGAPTVKYWNDVGPHLHPGVRDWLERNATSICCSPMQAGYMGLDDVAFIPPPVNLDRFTDAADHDEERKGAVCVASWRNYGKGAHRAAEWAKKNGGVDFYGGGPLAPPGAQEVPYELMPKLLAQYQTFVFLPTVIEPFGRLVAEAWAAGCEVVTNNLVGAKHWVEQAPAKIQTAPSDFWATVLA
jgi:glycosyltransferase involved in cell wall biosynthesis